jgi:intein/homing endonuclease
VQSDSALKVAWLRAFFDAEAYVYVNGRRIRVESVNGNGLAQVLKLLKSLDINSSFYTYKRKNKKWKLNYILTIGRKSDIQKYARLICFNNIEKKRKLRQLLRVCRGAGTRPTGQKERPTSSR